MTSVGFFRLTILEPDVVVELDLLRLLDRGGRLVSWMTVHGVFVQLCVAQSSERFLTAWFG